MSPEAARRGNLVRNPRRPGRSAGLGRSAGSRGFAGPGPVNGLHVLRVQLRSDNSGSAWNSVSVRPTRFSTAQALLAFWRDRGWETPGGPHGRGEGEATGGTAGVGCARRDGRLSSVNGQ